MTDLANINDILVILLIVIGSLVLIIAMLSVIQLFRRQPLTILTFGWIPLILIIPGLSLMVLVTYRGRELNASDWAQVILMITLVVVTTAYALSASRQASANVKMAEEMREQRLNEARPYILLRLAGEFVQFGGDNLNVTVENVGKGPAKNLNVALWNLDYDPVVTTKGFLGPNEDWNVEVSRSVGLPHGGNLWLPKLKELVRKYSGKTIAVKYEDIHNRAWASYLCLEETDVPGYFMDGELGIVEVTQHD